MTGIPIGSIMLVVVSILIYFGVAQRLLDRMRLTDKAALGFIMAMFIGTYLPELPLGANISINIGGAIIPLALCGYLLVKADTGKEKLRATISAIITALALYGVYRILPSGDPGGDYLDPLYIQGIIAGLVAYLAGRSRRSAFIGGVVGVLLYDLLNAWVMARRGIAVSTALGGSGVFDGMLIAGLLGIMLAELIGESREKLQGGPTPLGQGRPKGLKGIQPTEEPSFKGLQPDDVPNQLEDREGVKSDDKR